MKKDNRNYYEAMLYDDWRGRIRAAEAAVQTAKTTPCDVEGCENMQGFGGARIAGLRGLCLCAKHHRQFWSDETFQRKFDKRLYGG